MVAVLASASCNLCILWRFKPAHNGRPKASLATHTTRPPIFPPVHCPSQADEADRQKLRTAALKMRLDQLARERRSREATATAILEAKQRELDRQASGSPAGHSSLCAPCGPPCPP
jgi:hypothetical protein